MSITVYDCLRLPSLRAGRLAAGKSGLDRIVSSVSVVEIPEVHQEIKVFNPNELSISSLYAVKEDPAAQCATIRNLSEMGVAALVLFYVGGIIKDLAEEVIKTADELSMPLILIEDEQIRYSDIITDIMTAVIQDQMISDDFVASTKIRLQQIPESKRDMDNLLEIITSSYKCNLLLYHNSGIYFPSVYRNSYGVFDADYFLGVFREEPPGYACREVRYHGCSYYVYKMDFSHGENSWLTMYASCTANQLNESVMSDICACTDYFSSLWGYSLDMQSSRTLLSLILKSSRITAEKYLRTTGIRLCDISNLVIFNSDEKLAELEIKTTEIFEEYRKFHISDIIDGRLVILTSLSLSDKLDSLLVQDLKKIVYNAEVQASFFLDGERRDIPSLRRGYASFCANASAMDRIFLHRKFRDMHDVFFTEEVRTLIQKRSSREAHIRSIIQMLEEDHDNLLETLAVYLIDCNSQLNLTADTLFVHRNTVAYRLNKIKQISNTDFTKMPATYDYYLAAALYRLSES